MKQLKLNFYLFLITNSQKAHKQFDKIKIQIFQSSKQQMGSQICSTVQVNPTHPQPSTMRQFKKNVTIKSKVTDRVLDVCQDKDAYGTLIIYNDYNQLNQRFDILKAGENVYYIVNKKSGKYLTIGSNSEKNSAPIYEEPISGVRGQKFRLEHLGGNQYFIHTFCGKTLDLNNIETANGTRVIQQDFNRKDSQKWIIQG